MKPDQSLENLSIDRLSALIRGLEQQIAREREDRIGLEQQIESLETALERQKLRARGADENYIRRKQRRHVK